MNNTSDYKREFQNKGETVSLEAMMIGYLSNTNQLEELSKEIPIATSLKKLNKSVSKLMNAQEKIGLELSLYEINNANDAIKILNVWANEEVNLLAVTNQQQLVLNVQSYLKRLSVKGASPKPRVSTLIGGVQAL